MNHERCFTTRQVAEICGVNLNTVQNWARRDIISGFRTAGGHLRFREPELLAFLERQGIPLPEELGRTRPRVFCLCRECGAARAMARWLKRDFEPRIFDDPWELAVALGAESPDLLVVDLADDDAETRQMLEVLGRSPGTASLPVVQLERADAAGQARRGRAVLPRDGLRPAALRRTLTGLLAGAQP